MVACKMSEAIDRGSCEEDLSKQFKFTNITRGETLADQGRIASNPFARMKGLLGTKTLPNGEGLLIRPCQSVHTFFMAYPIDVLFLDKELRVVHMRETMVPNRISRHVFKARSVVELPAGTIGRTGTQLGDVLAVEE